MNSRFRKRCLHLLIGNLALILNLVCLLENRVMRSDSNVNEISAKSIKFNLWPCPSTVIRRILFKENFYVDSAP
jgi:hypothetical protein